MKNNFLSFATIRLCSTDISKSREYYQALFETQPTEDLDNFVSFHIAGVCLDISVADEKSPSSKGGAVGYWLVEDLDSLVARAKQIGGVVYRGPLKVQEVQRTIIQILDPVGNVMGFEAKF